MPDTHSSIVIAEQAAAEGLIEEIADGSCADNDTVAPPRQGGRPVKLKKPKDAKAVRVERNVNEEDVAEVIERFRDEL